MGTVHYDRRGNVAVITVDNPPVNAFSVGIPGGIVEGLHAAAADASIAAVVILGANQRFMAGADIRRLGKPWPDGEPDVRAAVQACEQCEKPVVAAIEGHALGGGLELAIACHYRVSAPSALLGQPEVKIGFPPGAGGTQRLPRLIDLSKAVEMIVSGDPITGAEAAGIGLVDRAVEGDMLEGACEFAGEMVIELAGKDTSSVLARNRDVRLDDPGVFDAYRARTERRSRGMHAPFACIECVEAAVNLPFDEGIRREREIFDDCVSSDEARALRHVFFAERQVGKIPGLAKDTPLLDIERVAVVGAGTMGGGIAMSFANASIPVWLLDRDQASLDRGIATIEKNYTSAVNKGRMAAADMRSRMSIISPVLDMEAVANADLAIEAVFEEMPLKLEILAHLDRVCKPTAILASNTSYLDVNALARATSRPQNVLGMHFFSPANIMRLLEIVRTDSVRDEVLATVMSLARRIRKIAVVAGVCHGFIGNRMLEGYLREAAFLLEEGALPQRIDRVMTEFGFPMGPFAMGDLAGLDIGWRKRKARAADRDQSRRYEGTIADRLCEQGRFGQKTGAGYYRYEPGSRTPVADDEVTALVEQVSTELGISRRSIEDEEILTRCVYPLVNIGADVLNEEIALRASDVDVVWINGYAFPAHRGGPMHYADSIGIGSVHDTICRYRETIGDWWAPSPLLEKLAREQRTFSDLDAKA